MGLKNPLHGAHNSLSRVSKFPSKGLKNPPRRTNANPKWHRQAAGSNWESLLVLAGGAVEASGPIGRAAAISAFHAHEVSLWMAQFIPYPTTPLIRPNQRWITGRCNLEL